MPTTLITADNLFAIKLEPGLEEILETSVKSDKIEIGDRNDEFETDIESGAIDIESGEATNGFAEEELENIVEAEEEGFSFYDASAPKVKGFKCFRFMANIVRGSIKK